MRLVGTVVERPANEHGQLTFDDVRDRVVRHLKFTIDRVNWFSTYHVHHRVAAKFREGRAFLLGDAAHVHSPVGGQGMNTGIGDAVNLAWKLAAVLNGVAADSLLDTYEPERIGFARRLVATTDRAFTIVTDQGPIAWRVRTRLLPLLVPLLFRLAAVRRFLFRTVSQISVNYRDSPLSEGAAGDVQGGDRLPWVETGPHEDNFAPLTSLAWQVHVYGEPPSGIAEVCAGLRLPIHAFAWTPEMAHAGLMRRGALSRPAGRLRRTGRSRRQSRPTGRLFHEMRPAQAPRTGDRSMTLSKLLIIYAIATLAAGIVLSVCAEPDLKWRRHSYRSQSYLISYLDTSCRTPPGNPALKPWPGGRGTRSWRSSRPD